MDKNRGGQFKTERGWLICSGFRWSISPDFPLSCEKILLVSNILKLYIYILKYNDSIIVRQFYDMVIEEYQ